MTNDFQFKNEWIDRTVTVLQDRSVVELSSGLTFPSIMEWLAVMQEVTQRCARAAALAWEEDDGLLRWQDEVVWFVATTYSFRGSTVVSLSDGSVRSADGIVWECVSGLVLFSGRGPTKSFWF
jgi:hypothetical protein